MVAWLRRHMVIKIFLAVALVTCLAFALMSLRVGSQVEGALKRSTEDSAEQVADLVRASIEQAMLSGNGIKVKDLIEELKLSAGKSETSIRVFDPMGIEVFAPLEDPPAQEEIPPPIREAIANLGRQRDGNTVVRAIPMEDRCAQCHSASDRLRGVLSMTLSTQACRELRNEVVTGLIRSGFIHLMTARQSHHLRQYFEDLQSAAPSIRAVAVYDAGGDAFFGEDMSELGASQTRVLDSLKTPEKSSSWALTGEGPPGTIHSIPLRKEERCIECHEEEEEIRGALLVALEAPTDRRGCDSAELEALIDTSLRHIMTSELGRIIARFLDSVVDTGAADELILYDNVGRVYWNTTHPSPPEHIAKALAQGVATVDFVGEGKDQRMRAIEPLQNNSRCARCHGAEMPLRGLVEVSMSTAKAAQSKAESKRIIIVTTVLAAIALLFVLIAFLQILVVRPVGEISQAADSIGDGNFDVAVGRANAKGDEVARLGDRINVMTRELRTKFHLEKLVSRGAAEAARSGRMQEHVTSGRRVEATILFSDIRGFTSYSEKVDAEEVVAMLNNLLKAQTDVVHQYGGDIDKFVGDELMAVFQGDKACARACQCAVTMLKAVRNARKSDLDVGIGIATGEVVMGAIGHESRLDFTVIGDVVNTGARLCSAARPGQVLVTNAVRLAASELTEDEAMQFSAMEPMHVKGKAAALDVFEVRDPEMASVLDESDGSH